jgi:hypothetical protein
MLGMEVFQKVLWRLIDRYREQARSHKRPQVGTSSVNTTEPLWERACSR